MDWDLFIGRFHPLVVHFPVALLVVAAVMEALSRFTLFNRLAAAIPFLLFFGTFTALVSMILGWFIAGDRGYDESTLFWHRWLGVSVFVTGSVLCLASINLIRLGAKRRLLLFALVFFLVSITGHLGGALTHGENYLSEYAPAFIRNLVAPEPGNKLSLNPNPDSVIVFRDLISPIFEAECMPCHNASQRKGGLDLSSIEGIERGGDNGLAIIAGKSAESEIFRRISLNPSHPKFMPVRKTPLSFSAVSILKWWIDNGASYDDKLTAGSVDEVREFLIREFNYDPVVKPYYEITSVEPADPEKIRALAGLGFRITPLANGSNYLMVSAPPGPLPLTQLQSLLTVSEQITWLDVSACHITDEHLGVIVGFHNLTRLNIHSNPVSDAGITKLNELKHLEVLNLYKTSVSDEIVETISSLPSIKRVFIWQTNLSAAGVEKLIDSKPTLQIDSGFRFD